MEQECIAAVYQSLGMSAGAELSSEDVSSLFNKVFHVPSNTNEAHAAMRKIAGGNNSWSCAGENVLDVLLEMERERERKEMLYWDFQLLNTRSLMGNLHQSTEPGNFRNACNSEYGSSKPCTIEMDSPRKGGLVRKNELWNRMKTMKRLKKAAGQCWARLVSEGVQSILSASWQDQKQGLTGQAWACVSLSDVLLLVEVKYDVVAHLLYREMLQEDYTQSVWETFLPWQQQKEVEVVEDFAEEALEHVDMLRLAELPGAFRIYKACLDASLRSCPEFKEQSWSAVSLLYDLHTFRQQEQNTLAALGQRLQGKSLRLLCLSIRLATLRAHREKMSYGALLAARQSWETWPQVVSPCKTERAALWLSGEEGEKEEKENFKTLEQKAALQLLVLTQEQERKHLVKLVHGISLEDLEGSGYTMPPKAVTDSEQVTFRAGCVKRLRQIHTQLQTNPQTQMQREWSKLKLEDCTVILLTHLMELQEVQAAALLQALVDGNTQRIKALRDQYDDEIQTQRFTNLLHLLTSDALLTAGSTLVSNFNEKSNNEQLIPQAENISSGSAEAMMADSIKRTSSKQTADVSNRQDVCSGCGVVVEDLPYLEILCVPDAQGNAHESLAAEGGASKEEEDSAIKSSQSYEKQGSLITLAWSKRPEDDTDYEAEAADGKTDQIHDVESMRTQVQPTQYKETAQDRYEEELTLKTRPIDDQPHEKQAASKSDQQTATLVAENRQAIQQHLIADSSEHADDLCSGIPNHTANADGDETGVETESELWELRGPELSDHEDLTLSKESTVDCSFSESEAMREPSLMERERVREPVSALERERTMQNLVDIQRKVEQRQQRDRDRQWLRVKERLSIIQNRKAEEDLLGLKHTDRLKHVTQDLPLEDKNQQKTVVRVRLEQLRRERSYIMQSRRDRNTAGFKELLAPVARHGSLTEDGAN